VSNKTAGDFIMFAKTAFTIVFILATTSASLAGTGNTDKIYSGDRYGPYSEENQTIPTPDRDFNFAHVNDRY
jgi:hypothetical protein